MNERWAKLVIDHLVEHGVRRLCLAPGSRSTPLAYAAAQDDRLQTVVHFDERGVGFHAFGFAKATKTPTAILVSSGSAVGNLFPAVMEASLEGVPLILLTADRPPELRDAGANQTCDQVKIFGSYVRWQCDLPCHTPEIPDSFIGTTIAHAVFRAMHSPRGPVHLNFMVREPFFTGAPITIRSSTHYDTGHLVPSPAVLESWAKKMSHAERGVIVVGELHSGRSLHAIEAVAEHLGWPILPDLLSGFRSSDGSHLNTIPYYDAIIQGVPLSPDFVLHLGDRIVSSTVAKWMSQTTIPTYVQVADHPFRSDPLHALTHRVVCDPSIFCEHLLHLLPRKGSWLEVWKESSMAAHHFLEEFFQGFEGKVSEIGLIRHLHHHLPPHVALFFANSMPIRDADQFFFPKFFRGPIFGKRGLSGIDGNIATAIGIAEGSERPTVAVLGDLAALHDINSLAQMSRTKAPVIFVVVNNGGGGIFSFLPVHNRLHNEEEIFENIFAHAHGLHFGEAARLFGLPYHRLDDLSGLGKLVRDEKPCLIEITTRRDENLLLHEKVARGLKECFTTLECTV